MNFILVGYANERKLLEVPEICKECKTPCCKDGACAWSPDDFHPMALNETYFRALLKRGKTAIVHKTMNGQQGIGAVNPFTMEIELSKLKSGEGLLYLRPRNQKERIVAIFAHENLGYGQCMLLTDNGCSLPFCKRPKGGREIIPKRDHDCIALYDEYKAAYDWWPYQEILYKLYKEFRNYRE